MGQVQVLQKASELHNQRRSLHDYFNELAEDFKVLTEEEGSRPDKAPPASGTCESKCSAHAHAHAQSNGEEVAANANPPAKGEQKRSVAG